MPPVAASRRQVAGTLLPMLAALALRVAAAYAPGLPPPGTYEDVEIAANLALGHGFCLDPALGRTAVKAPAYPILLAPLLVLTRDRSTFLHLASLVNALLALITIFITGRIATRLFGEPVARHARWLLALYPAWVYLARVPEATHLSVALASLAFFALIRAGDGSSRAAAIAGLAAGAAALSNPVALVGLGATAARLLSRRRSAIAALAFTLAVAPWTLRNYLAFGRLVVVKTPAWMNVYLGFLPENAGGWDPLPPGTRERVAARTAGRGDLEKEAVYRDTILPWMKQHPGTAARMALWRAGQFWGLWGARPTAAGTLDWWLRRLPGLVVAALALAALPPGWRQQPRATAALVSFLAGYTLVHALTSAANLRYRLELIWVEAILASLTTATFFTRTTAGAPSCPSSSGGSAGRTPRAAPRSAPARRS
jgi:hypothetical protein